MTKTVTIVIRETATRRGVFEARTENGRKVAESTTPFLDAARTLLGQGYSPDTILTMRHEGSQTEALRAPIGTAAELVISGGRFVAREKATGAAGKPEEGIDQDGVPLDAELAGGAAAHVPDAVGQMLYCGRTLRGGWVRR